jgi:hypothetical protein
MSDLENTLSKKMGEVYTVHNPIRYGENPCLCSSVCSCDGKHTGVCSILWNLFGEANYKERDKSLDYKML